MKGNFHVRFLEEGERATVLLYSAMTRMRADQIAEGLRDENKDQLINYLKATNKEVNERKEISEIESSNPCSVPRSTRKREQTKRTSK